MSVRYIASGSENFSPSLKAAVGEVEARVERGLALRAEEGGLGLEPQARLLRLRVGDEFPDVAGPRVPLQHLHRRRGQVLPARAQLLPGTLEEELRKGEKVLKMNYAAIDAGLNGYAAVAVPGPDASSSPPPPAISAARYAETRTPLATPSSPGASSPMV